VSAPSDAALRARIVEAALSWRGTPYRHQASLKGVGCDCLGLLRGVWREVIGPEPETPEPYPMAEAALDGEERLLAAALRHLVPVDTARPGDVLVFRWRDHLPARHCAIVVDGARMVHAQDGAAVCAVAISPWWRRHIAGAFAFPHPYTER